MATNLEGYLAEYQGPGERKKNGIWFKSTHFSMGEDKTSHHHSHSQRAQLQLKNGGEKTVPLNDANSMRRTHFKFGDDNLKGISTTNANFQEPPQSFMKPSLDQETKDNLKKCHFDLGGHPNVYGTTNLKDFQGVQSSIKPGEIEAQKNRQNKM